VLSVSVAFYPFRLLCGVLEWLYARASKLYAQTYLDAYVYIFTSTQTVCLPITSDLPRLATTNTHSHTRTHVSQLRNFGISVYPKRALDDMNLSLADVELGDRAVLLVQDNEA